MKKIECEIKNNQALLITSKISILYFTNCKYSNQIKYILIINNKYYLFIHNLNKEKFQYKNIIIFFNYIDMFEKINKILIDNKKNELKIEIDDIKFVDFEIIKKYIKINILNIKNIFNISRAIKSKFELNKIIKAQEINEKALYESLNIIKLGISEIDLKNYLIKKLFSFGAQKLAFDPIIAFGNNTSFPHHISNNTILKHGDFIIMDFGCMYDYYCSDMTRTFGFNYISDEQKKIYDIVLKTQISTIKIIKPGILCSKLNLYARNFLKKYQYEKFFNHAIGHSLGLNIHEYPYVNQNENYKLKSGNIITIEPGIYFENKFGIRIEDMIFIKKNQAINLTNINKELFIIK